MSDSMNTTTIATISADKFWRLAAFASTEDARYYLNGVCVQFAGIGTSLVATDGHILGAWLDESAYNAPVAAYPDGVIISTSKELVAAAKKLSKAAEKYSARARLAVSSDGSVRLYAENDEGERCTTVGKQSFSNHIIDGTFPDWRRVLPDPAKREPIGDVSINPDLLAPFKLGDRSAAVRMVYHGKGSPIGVHVAEHDEFYGVLMPMRAGDSQTRPAWIDVPVPDSTATAVAAE